MSTPPDVDLCIIDHGCRWSRADRDGACLDCGRTERRTTLKSLAGISPALAINLGPPVVSPDQLDPCQIRRRSEFAGPGTTTKSP